MQSTLGLSWPYRAGHPGQPSKARGVLPSVPPPHPYSPRPTPARLWVEAGEALKVLVGQRAQWSLLTQADLESKVFPSREVSPGGKWMLGKWGGTLRYGITHSIEAPGPGPGEGGWRWGGRDGLGFRSLLRMIYPIP